MNSHIAATPPSSWPLPVDGGFGVTLGVTGTVAVGVGGVVYVRFTVFNW